jgi:cyanate lyase
MTKSEMSQALLDAKKAKRLTWQELSAAIGMSEVYLASICYGEASASDETAKKLAQALDVGEAVMHAMTEYPLKGNSLEHRSIPTDPLLYRFYEILAVYGFTLKDVIQEKFGDGIMSAIDFTMDVQKQADPKGDRVLITMNGKFLPYKKW